MQVIIATHDAQLARSVESIHAHHQPDELCMTIVNPAEGSRLERRRDDFEHSMLEAKGQMSSPLAPNRRAAGNSLRIAAERLAKHIIVEGRRLAGDTTASLDDYAMESLGKLELAVTKYSVLPEEPGYWTNLRKTLNPADHDAEPPLSADLKRCHDWLRLIKKRHGTHTSES